MASRKKQEISEDTRILVVVLCLLFAYPAGLILAWVWTDWPTWLKIVLTIPIFLFIAWMIFILFFVFAMIFSAATQTPSVIPPSITPLPTLPY